MSRHPKINWFRESLYGNYVPDVPHWMHDKCWISQTTSEKGRYRAGCFGDDKYFKSLQAAKRWCERRIGPRLPAGMR